MNNIDTSKFDAVLICDDINAFINEGYGDDRTYGHTMQQIGKTTGNNQYLWVDDPKLYAANAFGKLMQNDLNNWKKGFSAKVSDFGKWVVVEVIHHNYLTGRSASKTFLVVFDGGPKGNDAGGGIILSTATKWRTFSGYGQATSYIKSVTTSLENQTSQKI